MGRAGAAEQPSAACQHLDPWAVELKTKCVFYAEDFLPSAEADALYEELRGSLRWETNSSINRMTALHGDLDDDAENYHYKDAPSLKLQPWTAALSRAKALVEKWYAERSGGTAVEFNVCLCNYYVDGQHRIGWHTDREEIGSDPHAPRPCPLPPCPLPPWPRSWALS